jgi:hypothetical protein
LGCFYRRPTPKGYGFTWRHAIVDEYYIYAVKGGRVLLLHFDGVDAVHGTDKPAFDSILAAIYF